MCIHSTIYNNNSNIVMITIPNLGLFDAVWYTALLLPLLALARQSRGRDPLEGAVCRGRGVAYVGVSPHGDIQKWVVYFMENPI